MGRLYVPFYQHYVFAAHVISAVCLLIERIIQTCMRKSKLGLILATTYLLLVIASILYALYKFHFAPINSEFAGLGSILLTLPLSLMTFSLFDSVLNDSLIVTFSIISLCAVFNAGILYLIGAFIDFLIESRLR